MTSKPTSHTESQGRLRILTRVTWLILVGTLLAIFAFGVPFRFNSLIQPVNRQDPLFSLSMSSALEVGVASLLSLEEGEALKSLGISLNLYAAYILVFDIALVLIGTIIGFLIFWHKSNDWMALWVSIIVILLGTNGASLVVPSLMLVWSGWVLLSLLFGILGMVSNVHLLFLSPDGRFVPGWTQALSAGFAGGMLGVGSYSLFIFLNSGRLVVLELLIIIFPLWIILLGMGIVSQIYRYQRISGFVQRQQTKWVAIGLAAVSLGFFLNASSYGFSIEFSGLQRVILNFIRAPLVNLCMALFPICLAFSIFRYRLWDIDLIIRRTLQYSLLSGLLALIYFGLVIVLQSMLSAVGSQQSEFVIVASTLAIAALFFPLRNRVQAFIDRRFYRQKYDAQKVLAEFAATCRDETDLDKLTARLAEVIDDTLQPEQVSVWLKPANDRRRTIADGGRYNPSHD